MTSGLNTYMHRQASTPTHICTCVYAPYTHIKINSKQKRLQTLPLAEVQVLKEPACLKANHPMWPRHTILQSLPLTSSRGRNRMSYRSTITLVQELSPCILQKGHTIFACRHLPQSLPRAGLLILWWLVTTRCPKTEITTIT